MSQESVFARDAPSKLILMVQEVVLGNQWQAQIPYSGKFPGEKSPILLSIMFCCLIDLIAKGEKKLFTMLLLNSHCSFLPTTPGGMASSWSFNNP